MVNVAMQLDALAEGVSGETRAVRVGLFLDIPTARVLTLDHEAREFRFTDPGLPDSAV